MNRDTSTSRATPDPAPTTAPAGSAEKKALLDAFDTVLKTQAEEREASLRDAEARRRARASSRPLLAASALVVLGLGAYLAIVRPAWVFAPRASPETLAIKEASLRIAMANVSQHVHHFQQRNGRLPDSLAEASAGDHGLSYQRLGASSYRLVGENGPAHVTFSSEEPLTDFLGNSYQIIARRPR